MPEGASVDVYTRPGTKLSKVVVEYDDKPTSNSLEHAQTSPVFHDVTRLDSKLWHALSSTGPNYCPGSVRMSFDLWSALRRNPTMLALYTPVPLDAVRGGVVARLSGLPVWLFSERIKGLLHLHDKNGDLRHIVQVSS